MTAEIDTTRRFRPLHWAGRFAGSVRPGAPTDEALDWVTRSLSDREAVLFTRMSNPDQRHAVAVALAVAGQLAETETTETETDHDMTRKEVEQAVIAASLLHDVGKTAAGMRTYGRVIATLSGAIGGRDYAEHWQDTKGITRRVGLYLRYPELGGEMLEVSASHPWVIAWAREHHNPEDQWTVPVELGRLMAAADR
jgi:hypothetical protein